MSHLLLHSLKQIRHMRRKVIASPSPRILKLDFDLRLTRPYQTQLLEYKFSSPYQSPDLKLRCTEFDRNGKVTETSREFSKVEICSKHGLQPRDLRKIDSTYLNQYPGILVREKAILINMLQIKAIIKADSVIIFDSFNSKVSKEQSLFIYDLQERLRVKSNYGNSLPLEFRALESIMLSVVHTLHAQMESMVQITTSLLIQLEDTIDRDKLKRLLDVSKKLSNLNQKVLNIRSVIMEVLDQDEDLAAMYLSAKKEKKPRSIHQHEEIEMLLETYSKQIDEIANTIAILVSNVKSTEDIVNIILDSQRNSLLLLELQVTIITLGITASAFIAACFGMNLKSKLEEKDNMFLVVTISSIVLGIVMCTSFMRRMKFLLKKIR